MGADDLLPAVELRDVSFAFRRSHRKPLEVLDNLTLSIKPSEIVSLVGPSGCGKTTILKIIAGLLNPCDGSVRIAGNILRGGSARCGYVPQGYSLFPWLTVRENIEYGLQFAQTSRQGCVDTSVRLLEMTGLVTFANNYPNTLSSGMQQRVALARALAIDPAILLLDEPFGALDVQTRSDIQQYFLHAMQGTPTAVVLVTHDIAEAVLLSDTIAVLNPRPSSIRKFVIVPLRRPRPTTIWDSDEAVAIYRSVAKEIWKDLQVPRIM